jgi:hypothetical protein
MATQTQPRRKSSIFTLSTVSSGWRKSANSTSSSSSSVITDPQALPNSVVPVGGGVVYAPPVTPCIVLFAHKSPERGLGEEMSRSFLIIDGELTSEDLLFWMQRIFSVNADDPKSTRKLLSKSNWSRATTVMSHIIGVSSRAKGHTCPREGRRKRAILTGGIWQWRVCTSDRQGRKR